MQSDSCPSHFTNTERAPVPRLDGPQCWYGCFGEKKNLLPLLGYEPQFVSPPSCSLVTMQTVTLVCINSLTYSQISMCTCTHRYMGSQLWVSGLFVHYPHFSVSLWTYKSYKQYTVTHTSISWQSPPNIPLKVTISVCFTASYTVNNLQFQNMLS